MSWGRYEKGNGKKDKFDRQIKKKGKITGKMKLKEHNKCKRAKNKGKKRVRGVKMFVPHVTLDMVLGR
jgi:hypothetical protein